MSGEEGRADVNRGASTSRAGGTASRGSSSWSCPRHWNSRRNEPKPEKPITMPIPDDGVPTNVPLNEGKYQDWLLYFPFDEYKAGSANEKKIDAFLDYIDRKAASMTSILFSTKCILKSDSNTSIKMRHFKQIGVLLVKISRKIPKDC
ncbi:hypothetical protein DMENIID0001_053580 [Sergentomyia squamirostris]